MHFTGGVSPGQKSIKISNLKNAKTVDVEFVPPPPQYVSQFCTDSTVHDMIALESNNVLLAGNFTRIGPCAGAGVPVDKNTGGQNYLFNPTNMMINGSINISIADGSGGWFIGGTFDRIGSQSIQYLARIKADGALDTSFTVQVDGAVESLLLRGNTLYMSGNFHYVNNTLKPKLAAVDVLTSSVVSDFNPGIVDKAPALVSTATHIYAGGNFTKANLDITGSQVLFDLADGSRIVGGLPYVDGPIRNALQDASGGWYIAGHFTKVGGVPRNNLAYIQSDGSVSSWNPNVTGGSIEELLIHGDNIIIGGWFNTVNGNVARSYLAAINKNTGLATDWNPNPDGSVSTMLIEGNTLYVGGGFNNLNGSTPRARIGAVDLTTGTATAWNPGGMGVIAVNKLLLSGTKIYVGGLFSFMGGQNRPQLARLDLSTGNADAWVPAYPNTTVFDLALSGDGNTLYVGGAFTSLYKGGSTARNHIAALNTSNGNLTAWDPNLNSAAYALQVVGGQIYVSGLFTSVNGGSAERSRMAALNLSDGLATGWSPSPNAYASIFVVSGGLLYAGGYFSGFGGQDQGRLVALNPLTGQAEAWNPNIANNQVNSLAIKDDIIYAGGTFTNVTGVGTRNRLAAFRLDTGAATAWDPNVNQEVKTLAIHNNTLYAGGSFSLINGGAARSRLAAVDINTGVATSWDPSPDGTVFSLSIADNKLLIGGSYKTINGVLRNAVSSFNLDEGVFTSWAPSVGGTIYSISTSGTQAYLAGQLTTFPAKNRGKLAIVNYQTGEISDWNPNIVNGDVRTIAKDGNTLYAGGYFSVVNGSVTRNRLAAFDMSTGQVLPWDPDIQGTNVNKILLHNSSLFVGGSFNMVNGATVRNYLAELNLSDAVATAWNPNVNWNVNTFAIKDGYIYIGGSFTTVNGVTIRSRLAALSLVDGLATAWDPNLTALSVLDIKIKDDVLYVGGNISSVDGDTQRRHLVAFDINSGLGTISNSWNPGVNELVQKLVITDSTLYALGNFTTLGLGAHSRVRLAEINLSDGSPTNWIPAFQDYATYDSGVVMGNNLIIGGNFSYSHGNLTRTNITVFSRANGEHF